jgi:hypothetical protein
VPQDSELYGRAVASIKKELKEKILFLAHKGQMIWGERELKVPTTFACSFEHKGTSHNFESLIKPTKSLPLRDLDNPEQRPKMLQILNIRLKNTLKALKFCELGKPGNYFESTVVSNE